MLATKNYSPAPHAAVAATLHREHRREQLQPGELHDAILHEQFEPAMHAVIADLQHSPTELANLKDTLQRLLAAVDESRAGRLEAAHFLAGALGETASESDLAAIHAEHDRAADLIRDFHARIDELLAVHAAGISFVGQPVTNRTAANDNTFAQPDIEGLLSGLR